MLYRCKCCMSSSATVILSSAVILTPTRTTILPSTMRPPSMTTTRTPMQNTQRTIRASCEFLRNVPFSYWITHLISKREDKQEPEPALRRPFRKDLRQQGFPKSGRAYSLLSWLIRDLNLSREISRVYVVYENGVPPLQARLQALLNAFSGVNLRNQRAVDGFISRVNQNIPLSCRRP